jgi:hypothetical protein
MATNDFVLSLLHFLFSILPMTATALRQLTLNTSRLRFVGASQQRQLLFPSLSSRHFSSSPSDGQETSVAPAAEGTNQFDTLVFVEKLEQAGIGITYWRNEVAKNWTSTQVSRKRRLRP